MIAQISRTAPPPSDDRPASRRIPPYIYPDTEDRDRCIVFTITGYTQKVIYRIDLSIQVKRGGRWYLGQIQSQDDGWTISNIKHNPFSDGVIHESVEAAAMSAHGIYREANRAARIVANQD